ncbi:nuclear transport factor 2 family protein [Arthrobacter sp. TWP1-1]|uniref:nuclear transport factor 2 family protein n=1 Tax=Arthrobacter sp. TWP1-1 TaxID=2804568 RepID=UPI003CEA4FCE
MTESFTRYDPLILPAPVVTFLDAHDEKRYAEASATFSQDATVIDDGNTYEGIDAVSAWLQKAASEITFTSMRTGQMVDDEIHPVVQIRLEGNFPGGTVTLRYQFELHVGLISRLAIEI